MNELQSSVAGIFQSDGDTVKKTTHSAGTPSQSPSESRDWKPVAPVLAHDFGSVPDDAIFFRPPPTEIGEVLRANSTLKPGEDGVGRVARLALGPGMPIWIAAIGCIVAEFIPAKTIIACGTLGFILGAIVGLIVWSRTRFYRNCTYVGSLGAARYNLRGSRLRQPKLQLLLFAGVTELRNRQARVYAHGMYSHTEYDFIWTDAQEKRVFRLRGHHKSKDGTPKATSPFWFASSAEYAWTNYRMAWAAQQISELGYAQFDRRSGNFVRVGQGFFEFGIRHELHRVAAEDIKSLTINDGKFHVIHKDARWFSSKGKFIFSYATMANAQLFLLVTEKLTGYTLT